MHTSVSQNWTSHSSSCSEAGQTSGWLTSTAWMWAWSWGRRRGAGASGRRRRRQLVVFVADRILLYIVGRTATALREALRVTPTAHRVPVVLDVVDRAPGQPHRGTGE